MKIAGILGSLAAWVSCLSAYGMFVSSGQNTPVYSGNAVGFISVEQNIEQLDLYVYVQKDYMDTVFAWIIPLPAMPEVSTPELSAFTGLSRISAPVYKQQYDYGCEYSSPEVEDLYGKDYYEVLGYEMIYPQTSDTLYVENIDTLVNWLAAYNIPLSAQSQNLVTSYINKGWMYFYVAVYRTTMYHGKVGISLKFASEIEVLPMEIARGNAFTYYCDGYYSDYDNQIYTISIYTYSITDHKRAHALGKLLYANYINQDEAANIAADFPTLGAMLENGDFMTKLRIDYPHPDENIVDDIILTVAADDDEFRELYEEYDYVYMGMSPLFILILLGILFFKNKLRQQPSVKQQ